MFHRAHCARAKNKKEKIHICRNMILEFCKFYNTTCTCVINCISLRALHICVHITHKVTLRFVNVFIRPDKTTQLLSTQTFNKPLKLRSVCKPACAAKTEWEIRQRWGNLLRPADLCLLRQPLLKLTLSRTYTIASLAVGKLRLLLWIVRFNVKFKCIKGVSLLCELCFLYHAVMCAILSSYSVSITRGDLATPQVFPPFCWGVLSARVGF